MANCARLVFVCAVFWPCLAHAGRAEHLVIERGQVFPARFLDGPTGSQFIARTAKLSAAEREQAIFHEVINGNVPDGINQLVPITLKHVASSGRLTSITVYAMPDYLAIGTDQDYVRIPVSFNTAKRLAAHLGLMLPTPKIVDAIYQEAEVRLSPITFRAGRRMGTNYAFFRHNQLIERQCAGGVASETILAGHKKDIVVHRSQTRAPGQVAIYGWHRHVGDPIQPVSLAHDADYVDYSHGVRFISETVVVDGKARSLFEVLSSPEEAYSINYEGAIRRVKERIMNRNSYSSL